MKLMMYDLSVLLDAIGISEDEGRFSAAEGGRSAVEYVFHLLVMTVNDGLVFVDRALARLTFDDCKGGERELFVMRMAGVSFKLSRSRLGCDGTRPNRFYGPSATDDLSTLIS